MNDDPRRLPVEDTPASTPEQEIDNERRHALRVLGAFAAYTTSAVTPLIMPQRATAQSSDFRENKELPDLEFSDIDELTDYSCFGLPNGKTAYLRGYRKESDGGEGWYQLNITGEPFGTDNADNVIIVAAAGVNGNGYWARVPDPRLSPHASNYPVTTDGPVYFSWLDPDPSATKDCRNKLQLALNCARTRAKTGGIGKLYITPGNFKVVATRPIHIGNVNITGLKGHKLWVSLPDDYHWSADCYYEGDEYSADNVIDEHGNSGIWTAICSLNASSQSDKWYIPYDLPWNGKTNVFTYVKGTTDKLCRIKKLVIDFGWGTENPPESVRPITGMSNYHAEQIFYQGFGNNNFAEFIKCRFSNAPGAYIETSFMGHVTVYDCKFGEYGDHVFYFGGNGTKNLFFHDNRIKGTRNQIGYVNENGIPTRDYVFQTHREALKFRSCIDMSIRNNTANIPNATFIHFETSGLLGPCGGSNEYNPAIVYKNKVNCYFFMNAYAFRRDKDGMAICTQDTQDPCYIQHLRVIDNRIKLNSAYFILAGSWSSPTGSLYDVHFEKNNIKTAFNGDYRLRSHVMLCANPDLNYSPEGEPFAIDDFRFIDNKVRGAIDFMLKGEIGKITVADNTIQGEECPETESHHALFRFIEAKSAGKLSTGKEGYIVSSVARIDCIGNSLNQYFAYVLQNARVVKEWSEDPTKYGQDIFECDDGSLQGGRSLVYDSNDGNFYVNTRYCTDEDPCTNEDPRPSEDVTSTFWELWMPKICELNLTDNVIRNDHPDGANYDLYMFGALPVHFRCKRDNNIVEGLDGRDREDEAKHWLSGAEDVI